MITKTTKYGVGYETPVGLTEDKYYALMYELIDFCKIKGLTVRQAQHLFADCFDMVLDIKIKNDVSNEEYLKSIADSLDKISSKGIDTFGRSSTTNY